MPQQVPVILEETLPVTSADTDFTKTLRPSSLVNMLIQIAWHHAEMLGFGMKFLHNHELVWMLSRMHIKIYSRPFWNSNLHLSSWPKGIHRLFYLRDFKVMNSRSENVAEATSEWLIIDLATRRPKLYQPENNIFQENKDRHAIPDLVPNLKSPEGKHETFFNKVVYSDIDLNHHLTTTRYLDWMMDTFDKAFHIKNSCTEIILNFIREIPFGAEVNLSRYRLTPAETYLFVFHSKDGKQLFFRAQLQFASA
jgi:acyl-ACP thioesterase